MRVPSRLVPHPRSISAEARAALARWTEPDGTLLAGPRYPAADDAPAWQALREEMAARIVAMMAPRLAKCDAAADTRTIDGVTVHVATPAEHDSGDARVYLDIHGGALVLGGGAPCEAGARIAAAQHGVAAYAVDYRMPPEHPYPAALDDCLAVYRWLLTTRDAADIVVGGSSAGGNLAAALILRARDEGLPLPAALVLLTPELDLTESGDSFEVNRAVDVVLQQGLGAVNAIYAAGHDLGHPYLSPLFGDFARGFPPTFLQAGTRDLFLSNAARMQRALRDAGVPVELILCEGMPHGGFFGAPEDAAVAAEAKRFVAAHWRPPTAG